MKNKGYVYRLSVVGLLVTSFWGSQALAEYYGLPNGRSADLSTAPDMSVEGGFVTGDVDDLDYQLFGARFNFKVAPNMVAFGDLTQTDLDGADGLMLGGGIFYQIDGLLQGTNTAFKGSYHLGEIEDQRKADLTGLALELLFSGEQLGTSNLGWYANVGLHRLSADVEGFGDDSDTEFGFGGGIFSSTNFGEFFFGGDMIDDLTFGGGIRYYF